MKKALVLFSIILLVISLAGCSQDSGGSNSTDPKLYTLSVDKEGKGNFVSPSGTGDFKYEEDSIADISLEPFSGNKFSYWEGKDSTEIVETDKNNKWKLNMNENKSIKAVFNREDIYILDLEEGNGTLTLDNFQNNEYALVTVFPMDDSGSNHLINKISVTNKESTTNELSNMTNNIKQSDVSETNTTGNIIRTSSEYREIEKVMVKKHSKLKKTAKVKAENYSTQSDLSVGSQESFKVKDNGTTKDVNATLKAKGDSALIWVDNSVSDITEADATNFLDEFESNIYTTVKNYFGREPTVEEFPILAKHGEKINILFTPLSNKGGYFWSGDLFSEDSIENSNERKIFFINSSSAMEYQFGTLAHEFQHMVYYNEFILSDTSYSVNDTWINEGFSTLAEDLTGYGYKNGDTTMENAVDNYVEVPNEISLINWEQNNDKHYACSYLFARYIYDRFGKEIIKYNNESPAGPKEDIAEFTDLSFKRIFGDWAITLTGISNEEIYNYSSISVPGIYGYTFEPGDYVQDVQVKGWGVLAGFVSAGTGKDINIDFDSDLTNIWMKVKRGDL